MKYYEQKRPDVRAALFIMILLFICVSISNGDVNVFRGRYGNNVLLYYVQGIMGAFLVYFITMFLSKKVKRLLIWLGQNTVFILVTHQFLLYNIYVRYTPPVGDSIKERIIITCISIFLFVLIMCIEVVSIFVIKKYMPFLLSYKYLKKYRKDKVQVSIKGEE